MTGMAAPKQDQVQKDSSDDVSKPVAVMLILLLIFFLGNSDLQMISPLLPLIADEQGMEVGRVGAIIFPAYHIAAAIAALTVGPLSDRYGRRKFLLVAAVVFAFSLLIVPLNSNLGSLAVLRVLAGLAAGIFSTCSIAYVADYFPYKRRGVAMSVVQAGLFIALVIGVPVANQIAHWSNWRLSFAFFGLVSVVAAVLVLFVLPDDGVHPKLAEDDNTDRARRMKIALTGKDRRAAIVAAFLVSAGFVGFFSYLGSWLKDVLLLPPGKINLFFILVGVALLIGAFVAGPVSDRLGKKAPSIGSTVILALMLVIVPRSGWGIVLFVALLVAALAFAFRQGPLQALATEMAPRHARGTFVSVRNTASQVGIAVSAASCGWLYDSFGYATVGLLSGIVTLSAAAAIAVMREPKHSV